MVLVEPSVRVLSLLRRLAEPDVRWTKGEEKDKGGRIDARNE